MDTIEERKFGKNQWLRTTTDLPGWPAGMKVTCRNANVVTRRGERRYEVIRLDLDPADAMPRMLSADDLAPLDVLMRWGKVKGGRQQWSKIHMMHGQSLDATGLRTTTRCGLFVEYFTGLLSSGDYTTEMMEPTDDQPGWSGERCKICFPPLSGIIGNLEQGGLFEEE